MAFDTTPNPDDTEPQILRKINALLYGINGGASAAGTVSGGIADAGPAWVTVRGVSGVPKASADMTAAVAVTDAPTTGQKLVIDDLLVSTDTAMSVTFTEETSGDIIRGPIYMAANSTTQITLRGETKLAVADKKLLCAASVAGNLTVEAVYHSDA